LNAGDEIRDVVGPLGKPSHIGNFGTAVSIGGGVGTAIAFPTAKASRKPVIIQSALLVGEPRSL